MSLNIFLFLFFCLMTCFSFEIRSSTTGIAYFLNSTITTDAFCLDGSGPLYYHIPGSDSGSTKWYIYFEGGGWCVSLEDCFNRSQIHYGSTLQDPLTMEFNSDYFSNSPVDNLLMNNWNKVVLRYCDGGSFSGDNISSYQGKTLYFKGKKIMDAIFEDLFKNRGLSLSTDVVISGGSAGGLASILHGDYVHSLLGQDRKVVMLPDGGFFLDYTGYNIDYHSQMQWVFENMNSRGGVNQKCVEYYREEDWKCIFAEYTLPFVETPVFMLQSIHDSWQLDNILGTRNTSEVNVYGREVLSRLGSSFLSYQKNSGFVDSCDHHCGFWDIIHINNITQAVAFNLWYTGEEKLPYVQEKDFVCEECCH